MKTISLAILSGLTGVTLYLYSIAEVLAQSSPRPLRQEVSDTEFKCRTNPGEIILYFSQDGGSVLRNWRGGEIIKLKWESSRVLIGGKQDQDGPFYFQRRAGGGWEYAGHACRVTTLPRK